MILVIEDERDFATLAALLGPFGRPMPGAKWDDDLDKWVVVDEPPVQSDPGDENDWREQWRRDQAERKRQAQMQSDHEPPAAFEEALARGASMDELCEAWDQGRDLGDNFTHKFGPALRAAGAAQEPPHVPEMVRELEGDDEIDALIRATKALHDPLHRVLAGDDRRRHVDHADYYAQRASQWL